MIAEQSTFFSDIEKEVKAQALEFRQFSTENINAKPRRRKDAKILYFLFAALRLRGFALNSCADRALIVS
jgi:hypothetical protein